MVDKKKTFEEWLDEAEWPTAEESAKNRANREAAEGKCFQTVTMSEDQSIFVVTIQYFEGGGAGEGSSILKPGDPNYDQVIREHGPLEIGKAHTVVRKIVDGKWVVLPESDG